MRKDMKRVIIDTGRSHGDNIKGHRKRLAKIDLEDFPIRGKMRPGEGITKMFYGKEFGDRTGPLFRLLEKSVGRSWNKVYSEICKHADYRSVDGAHLRDHVKGFVSTSPNEPRIYNFFYVDEDGILRKEGKGSWKRRMKEQAEERKKKLLKTERTIDGKKYRKINGCWFLIIKEEVSAIFKKLEILEKRQLSSRDIKQLGLNKEAA